jgi:glucose/mannose-6-phosphate isomerase
MNLDDAAFFQKLDTLQMMDHIEGLPDQLKFAWELGMQHPLPEWGSTRQVVIAGMGGSAIGADLLASYVQPTCRVPVMVHRDYGLPAWAQGAETLVIASSHSGNTEEALSAFAESQERGCHLLALCTGGKLAEAGQKAGVPVWRFEHKGQPRSAVGFSFGLALAALRRLHLIPDPANELEAAVTVMKEQQVHFRPDVPAVHNPAKRYAGQLMGRWVTVIGAGVLAPVARRWKCQVNEIAKAWAQFEFLPEADHNSLAGVLNPQEHLPRMVALFLRGPADDPRHRLRIDLTRKAFMLEGIGTDTIDARGKTALANQWTALHFGDYTAYYLAMAYGVDPTPIETIEAFKKEMQAASAG